MATMELIDHELIREEFVEEYAYELTPEEEKALRRGEEDYRNGRWSLMGNSETKSSNGAKKQCKIRFLTCKIGKATLFSPYFSEQNNLSNSDTPWKSNLIYLIFSRVQIR